MIFIYFLLMMVPIVVIHELGHFYIGKWTGIKPEVFSVGFGPEIWKRTAKDGTIWRFAAIPFGGYVKFANDQNGTSFPNLDASKASYLAPYWAKIVTLLAGPFANFALSLMIFFIYATNHGFATDSLQINRVHMGKSEIAENDKILSVQGVGQIKSLSEFNKVTYDLPQEIEVVVERNEQNLKLLTINPNASFVVGIDPSMAAFKAGVRPKDEIISYGGVVTPTTKILIEQIIKIDEKPTEIVVKREGVLLSFPIQVITPPGEYSENVPRIGVSFGGIYETASKTVSVIEGLQYALSSTFWILSSSFQGIGDLVTGKVGIDAMSGPVGIGRMAEDSAEGGVWKFIWMLGLMSSAIGFMNLLPLPVLDGGHLVLITYEKIIGKLPPQKLLNGVFALGFGLLVGLMLITTTRELFG